MRTYCGNLALALLTIMAGSMVLSSGASAQDVAVLVAEVEVMAPAPAPHQLQLNLVQPAADADQLEPFLAQFRPVLRTELSLANRVCKFTDEQRTAAIAAGKAWLHDFVRDYVKNQGQAAQGVVFLGGMRRNANADPRRSIEEGVAAAVKKIVTAEQYAAYEAELAHRRDFYKQAAVENLVAMIDQRLLLSAKQRKAIAKSLTSNWDDVWAPQIESLTHMGNYLPAIPDERVTPHLSDQQITLWQGIQKVSFGHHFAANVQWIDGGQIIDDIDLDEGDEAAADGDAAHLGDGRKP